MSTLFHIVWWLVLLAYAIGLAAVIGACRKQRVVVSSYTQPRFDTRMPGIRMPSDRARGLEK